MIRFFTYICNGVQELNRTTQNILPNLFPRTCPLYKASEKQTFMDYRDLFMNISGNIPYGNAIPTTMEPLRRPSCCKNGTVWDPPSPQDITNTLIYDHARDSAMHQYHHFTSYKYSAFSSMPRFYLNNCNGINTTQVYDVKSHPWDNRVIPSL